MRALLVLLVASHAAADEWLTRVTLSLDSEVQPEHLDQWRTPLTRFTLSADLDWRPDPAVRIHLRPRFAIDAVDSERNRFIPREASVALTAGPVDVHLGLLELRWGLCEVLRPTDTLAPVDAGQGLIRPDRVALVAMQVALTLEPVIFEAVVAPLVHPARFPSGAAQLGFSLGGFDRFRLDLPGAARPPEDLDEVTFASRVRATLGPVELHAAWMSGPTRLPGPWLDDLTLRAVSYPIDVFGGALAWTVGPVVLRGEVAHTSTRRAPDFRVEENPHPYTEPIPPSTTAYVAGLEATLWDLVGDHDLTLVAEYVGEVRPYYDAQAALRPLQGDLYVAARWAFDDDDDTRLGVSAVIDLKRTDTLFRAFAERRLVADLVLRLEAALVFAGETGPLSVLHELSSEDVVTASLSWAF